jgi:hypothetical protein
MLGKLGRNDKCHCKSGKKYKQCCINKDETDRTEKRELLNKQYKDGHEITEDVTEMYEHFKDAYPKYKIIDVTNILTTSSYKSIATLHFEENTILLASRNESNNDIFAKRGDMSTDWIVIFRGAHQVFSRYSFEKMKDQLDKMIECRLKGEDYTY